MKKEMTGGLVMRVVADCWTCRANNKNATIDENGLLRHRELGSVLEATICEDNGHYVVYRDLNP